MAMSGIYGTSDDAESIATIHAAIDRGVNLLDTGDFYGMGDNEMLIAKALEGGKRDRVFIQVKFGAQRDPKGAFLGFDGRPSAVKTSLAYTLKRLRTDHIDLYQPARLDPNVPIEETVGAIAELIQQGYVRYIGLSEMGAETIRRANAVHPIAGLQIEYSLIDRSLEQRILPTTRELGIGITAYGVLSRGLLAGRTTASMESTDYRAHAPRWSAENEQRNLELAARLDDLANAKHASRAQLAMAWVLSRGDDIIPLAGSRKRDQLNDILGALDLTLTPPELAHLGTIVSPEHVAGMRYDKHGMEMLDSER
jgi:aryl-alcohol dehydrogenase-like predicted oxidoreductase